MASHGMKRKRDEDQSDSSNRFHSSQLQLTTESMEKTKNIMSEVVKKIQPLKTTSETTEFYHYIENIISNMDKSKEKKKTIGILGYTGEGKTTLLNALLGKRYLLPSGCIGVCTAVVTQVEANLTDHNYTAEIEVISKEEWETQLKDLLSIKKSQSKDKNKDLTDDAIEKITALYGTDAKDKTFEELKKIDIPVFANNKKDVSCIEVSEFASELKRYVQHNTSSTGHWYWPLVKSVKIKIPDCRELLEHIVLVDLPGSGDCNKTRAAMWKSKLRDCCSVWILSNINRAINNKDAWEMLNHCYQDMVQAGECRDINFICTKSDEMDPGEYNSTLEKQIPEDKNQMTNCILHRNKRAKETLEKSFENSEFKNENIHLQVFTVSSKAFFNHNLGVRRDDTEIPKLQDVLKKINKSINQELSRNYIKEASGVLSLIQSFQSDRRKRMAEADIKKELQLNLEKALEKLEYQFDMLRCFLDKGLSDGVDKSEKSCLDDAKEIISPDLPQGQGGFRKILQDLCRNGGSHTSKAWKRNLDLNKCLAKHMYENMNPRFNLIFPVNTKTGISVQELIDKFSIIQPDTANPPSLILQYINKFIKSQEDNLKELLKHEVVNKKKEIYTSVEATIQNAMASCYKEAAEKTGEGSTKEKQRILKTGIESLKPDIFRNAKKGVLIKTNELMEYIKKRMEFMLKQSIQYSFAKAIQNTMWDVSKEIEELEKLSAQLTDNTG
ncbi:nuclear GTPase SLIP-GC-like [Carassius auratus]|uniref:Nuclear GTPase SLIP-GC-like n=1 Tax=Carassius auratus TaxID=7957 RepID=A0A6P6KUU3_CARAU|nr:nuclear GTPase SLIP-GC-like [Carassius auratus]